MGVFSTKIWSTTFFQTCPGKRSASSPCGRRQRPADSGHPTSQVARVDWYPELKTGEVQFPFDTKFLKERNEPFVQYAMVGALTTLIVRDAPTLQHIDGITEATTPGGRINGAWKYPNHSQGHGRVRQVRVFYAINLRMGLSDVEFQVGIRLT